MRAFLPLVVVLFCVKFAFPQSKDAACSEVFNEIRMDESGIHPFADTLVTDASGTVYEHFADSSKSFWYKITFSEDCSFAFEIFPFQKGNSYNFFLYKTSPQTTACKIKTNKIPPVRANMYRNEMLKTGTGLSFSPAKNKKDIYNSPYQDAVQAKKGEIYFLNIYHVKGIDCGFSFTLRNEARAQKFKCLYDKCYEEPLQQAKLKKINSASDHQGFKNLDGLGSAMNAHPCLYDKCYEEPIQQAKLKKINTASDHQGFKNLDGLGSAMNAHPLVETAAMKNSEVKNNFADSIIHTDVFSLPLRKNMEEEEPKAVFLVRDSAKHEFIDAEVLLARKQKEILPLVSKLEKGKFEIPLEKNKEYHLRFSALGYKPFDVFFITGDSARAFTNEVYLSSLHEGDNFTMDKIYFHPNSSDMKEGALDELDKLAGYLIASGGTTIEIQGHTNGNKRIRKSYEGNFSGSSKKLSQCRAEKIKTYLVSKGISSARLSAIGYGGSKPVFPEPKNQTQANKNIRVEILILSQKETSIAANKRQE
ncbi:MAG: OmpA family protein [Bacteroidetes bacterium]|nr:OmpA family protein [Bacteroidota bacterium]